jgi:hypothetical protein
MISASVAPALHHRDHFRLLVGAIRRRLGGCFLRPGRLIRGLGLLAGLACAFAFRSLGRRLARVLAIDTVSLIEFLLARVAVVTVLTLVGRNSKASLPGDWVDEANTGWT